MKKIINTLLAIPDGGTPIPTLSPLERVILSLLISRGEMYALELVKASEGRLKRGSVYVTLNRMEEKGYISFRKEDKPRIEGGLPRPLYRATGLGEKVFRVWQMVGQQIASVGVML